MSNQMGNGNAYGDFVGWKWFLSFGYPGHVMWGLFSIRFEKGRQTRKRTCAARVKDSTICLMSSLTRRCCCNQSPTNDRPLNQAPKFAPKYPMGRVKCDSNDMRGSSFSSSRDFVLVFLFYILTNTNTSKYLILPWGNNKYTEQSFKKGYEGINKDVG